MNKKYFSQLLALLLLTIIPAVLKAQTTIWVTSNNDQTSSVSGELRYAITQANLASGTTTIKFAIGTGLQQINLVNTLPVISKTVILDGTTQDSYSKGTPTIVIDGTNGAGPLLAFGLKITFGNCQVKGIQFQKFLVGINIEFANSCQVTDCVINQVDEKCVILKSSSNCIIKGNYINTNISGTSFAIGAEEGIFFMNNGTTGSSNNVIGGIVCGEGNTIAHTSSEGIDNDPTTSTPSLNIRNTFSGNIIHSNTGDAIELRDAANINLAAPVISVKGCTTSGTSGANQTIELFGSSSNGDKKNANVYITTTVASAGGAWSAPIGYIQYGNITATARDTQNNTSELTTSTSITPVSSLSFTVPPRSTCFGTEVTMTNTSTACSGVTYLWDFGDGSPLSSSPSHYFLSTGTFTVKLYAAGICPMPSVSASFTVTNCTPCTDCIGSFAPDQNKEYVISAWVKKETSVATDLTYTQPQIYIDFTGASSVGPYTASGAIIDGWQRIEATFLLPTAASTIAVRLACVTGNCLFDDIRIFPVDGSMKSYVYDPINLRLVAELDERNYATFYEYDEEGKLVRVKKETEKGIMTIKENKNNTKKK